MSKVLILGSGGREHALAYKFSLSPKVHEVYVLPGNEGMLDCAKLVNIALNDFENIGKFVKENKIDLTFVGPEVPLVNGIVDYFDSLNLNIFGPKANAAILEGSKSFAKDIMKKYQIPTASYETFNQLDNAIEYAKKQNYPLVLKADGLAGGKGVVIVNDFAQAQDELTQMMNNAKFANAGNVVVIEEFLTGEEFSLMAFVKDDKVYPLPIAQDHKKAYDHDKGLNTGGMGSYTPVSHLPNYAVEEALNKVMIPMAKAMVKENRSYQGVLYGGFMLTSTGVKTIEFNCRFGDPETEVILQALDSDLYQIIDDIQNNIEPTIKVNNKYYLGVVMAAKGYPEKSNKGAIIQNVNQKAPIIFHMGTMKQNNDYSINGGRVLFISGEGDSLQQAYDNAYKVVKEIKCDDLFYRSDIGFNGLKKESKDD